MIEALYYKSLKDDQVQCQLCPFFCTINKKNQGLCGARTNRNGKLYSKIYGEVTSISLDPIEKKPLYHFYPNQNILSIGTKGCNFHCTFCQNWQISQSLNAHSQKIEPKDIVKIAKEKNSFGIAYTYSEPLIWFEFVLETARLAKQEGLKNVLVTNGFINEKPLLEVLPYIDALNIDIKSIDDAFYQKYCQGQLKPVLKTAELAKSKALVEITNLVIPTKNDSEKNFQDLTNWIYNHLGKETPLHFSAYFPQYKLTIPPTTKETLEKAFAIAKEKLSFVYLGNISTEIGQNTYCPYCQELLIERHGYFIPQINIKKGTCTFCQKVINVIN